MEKSYVVLGRRKMEGRLYTAQEIFDALQEATESLYDKDDPIKTYAVAKLGSDVAYGMFRALKFDEDKVVQYCKKKIKEGE
jgi:hypothetical protein